ncbi:peptidase MA family metallohydrolase [Chloroflexota bacterium]
MAALVSVTVLLALLGLWQLPQILASQTAILPATAETIPISESSGEIFPVPTAGSPPTPVPSPTTTIAPTLTPTPTPGPVTPVISTLSASADDDALTITFHMEASVPSDRHVAEAILWYDSETGHQLQRFAGPLGPDISLSYQHDAVQVGLTRPLTATSELDYWWFVRDSVGQMVRSGGTVILGPDLQAHPSPAVLAPDPPPIDFAWSQLDSPHFRFFYVPGSAAGRDLPQLVDLAGRALDHTSDTLDVEFDAQMSIYFIPRIFWQGGAAYPEKVQLISYLDRNFTGIETWSYFSHEGTHALAQDLLQPKEDGGGPDGVLVEGLAVWASGGHYREEPIDAWAAVVAASEGYIPLSELRAGPFYEFQHETAYLEAASFVKFLIDRYGLDKLKELYGQATSDDEHDEELVRRLYGRDYAALEEEWLVYLAGLSPTPQQTETWRLKVRSFDLMRRYESDMDPDARLLPSASPTEWTSDTLQIYLHRAMEPANVVLETALVAVQDRLFTDDPFGAEALLDDIEGALDQGGRLDSPSLHARAAILGLLLAQDRAIVRADAAGYRATLDASYAHRAGEEELFQMPITAYEQELVRLDLDDDRGVARGQVLVHGQMAGGTFAGDGHLLAVTFVRSGGRWLMADRGPVYRVLTFPSTLAE